MSLYQSFTCDYFVLPFLFLYFTYISSLSILSRHFNTMLTICGNERHYVSYFISKEKFLVSFNVPALSVIVVVELW